MKSKVIRGLRNAAGIVLVLAGIVLGPVPIIPGFVLVIIGLGLIDLPIKRRAHVWMRHRCKGYRRIALSLARLKLRRRLRRAAASTPP